MYYRDENGKVIQEGYDGSSSSVCGSTPLWAIILIVILLLALIGVSIYAFRKSSFIGY